MPAVSLNSQAAVSANSQTAVVDSLTDFLYRYMPLPDKGMYDRDFWQENVRISLKAKAEMPWGSKVPEREWRHFVLPVRVNNENLDMSRRDFYEELKPRVSGLGMKDAILEVNHWCHEKVTYQPSDARTSSPLSAVSQAIGRCGEESTFTVAALRSVGIPARQVYTPRWAHTDDNHAWVEAWADGQWYFLGACEPEPLLNLAWFNAPASRGMMMHTNVFGDYDGPEEVLERSSCYTTINVTGNYAPTGIVRVKVINPDGTPANGADVRFCIYNYAEYYPAATKKADESGMAELLMGKGDALIWASDGSRFGLAQGNASKPVTVVLDKDISYEGAVEFDLIPPPQSVSLPKPSAEQIDENNRRKADEDSIRTAYTATFATAESAGALASALGLDATRLAKVLVESRGNHFMIEEWLKDMKPEAREKAITLLEVISEKDRRDISRATLDDHLATPCSPSPLFAQYILNPRVENELLTPYKGYFEKKITAADRKMYAADPQLWINALKRHVIIESDDNPKQLRTSPQAVWEAGRSDLLGASICFVAGARSFGIPARIDPVTGKAQYADASGTGVDVNIAADKTPAKAVTGLLAASAVDSPSIAEPKYYSHFSISKIDGGFPRQLEYPEGMTLGEFLNSHPSLEAGEYVMTTGQRLANGGVLARSQFFTVKKGETTEIPFIFRHDDSEIQVIGSLNSESLYRPLGATELRSLLSTTGRGYYVLGIVEPNHEPSEHALNDISAMAKEFEEWPGKAIILFENEEKASRFSRDRFPKLPGNIEFGSDETGAITSELRESLKLPDDTQMPIFVVADTFNRVVYVSSGYTIGLGETLLSVLRRLR